MFHLRGHVRPTPEFGAPAIDFDLYTWSAMFVMIVTVSLVPPLDTHSLLQKPPWHTHTVRVGGATLEKLQPIRLQGCLEACPHCFLLVSLPVENAFLVSLFRSRKFGRETHLFTPSLASEPEAVAGPPFRLGIKLAGSGASPLSI